MAQRKTSISIGDLVRFPCKEGDGYLQVVNSHKQYGFVVRVFTGPVMTREMSPESVVDQEEQFVAFALPDQIVDEHGGEVMGNFPIPHRFREFPIFRSGSALDQDFRYGTWWIWDGVKPLRVDALSEKQKALPLLSILPLCYIVGRITTDWKPSDEVEFAIHFDTEGNRIPPKSGLSSAT